VGQTVTGLAHAIKNITGGLTGGTFVLDKGFQLNNEKYLRQGWDVLKGNVGRLKSMALDLLNYAKDREPDYHLCDPNRPAREVIDLMIPRALKNDISLEIESDESLPKVWLDPEGIHRCLLNLVTNAIDACINVDCTQRHGKVVLRILKTESWAVEFQVVDNGCGMDEETKEKIFQRFFSTKGSRGTGLGLMITKKIIDEHQGAIEFDSEKGKGTRFAIRLPEKDQSTSN
jgi:signal transduction histidine kinase